jgi:hypothetical protein
MHVYARRTREVSKQRGAYSLLRRHVAENVLEQQTASSLLHKVVERKVLFSLDGLGCPVSNLR